MSRRRAEGRDWSRRKRRELAGVQADPPRPQEAAAGPPAQATTDPDGEIGAARPSILSLTGEIDPADHRLGDLLRSLGLIEADPLTALLVEAPRQRRSLPHILLPHRRRPP